MIEVDRKDLSVVMSIFEDAGLTKEILVIGQTSEAGAKAKVCKFLFRNHNLDKNIPSSLTEGVNE